jgi:hypothetical protein
MIAAAAVAAIGEAPALEGLAALVGGEIDAAEWMARVRRAERARRAA